MKLKSLFCLIILMGAIIAVLLPELTINDPNNIIDGVVIHIEDGWIYVIQHGLVYKVEGLSFNPIVEGDHVCYEHGTLLKNDIQFAINRKSEPYVQQR